MLKPSSLLYLALFVLLSPAASAELTYVRFETTLGNFTVELDGDKAPITVQNFLQYVSERFYDNTIFHRSPKNFVVQGGGFNTRFQQKPTRAAIAIESNNGLSNVRGTIAMARTTAPNSATSQFFVNVVDNLFLNYQSAASPGYTVFGKVVDGMSVLDAINNLPVASALYPNVLDVFSDLPVADSTKNPPGTVIVTRVSRQPIAAAAPGRTIRIGETVNLDARNSIDPDYDEIVAYDWTAPVGVSLQGADTVAPSFTVTPDQLGQTLTFTLRVSDGTFTSSPATVSYTVVENSPPIVSLASTSVQEGSSLTLTPIVNDPDGDSLRYDWVQVAGIAVDLDATHSATLAFTAPNVASAQTLVFKLTVTDDFAPNPKSSVTTVNVTIENNASLLDCSQATASKAMLWPPKKSMVRPISILGVSGPGAVNLVINSVTTDEPVKNKQLKDTTAPDAKIVKAKRTKKKPSGADSVELRAERLDSGNGRVYAVAFTANDATQTCSGEVIVTVPLTPETAPTDDGADFSATAKR